MPAISKDGWHFYNFVALYPRFTLAQLKARIEQEQARISASARKERDGKLIAWGVAVEQLIADETFQAEWWKLQCERVLSGRTLERALAGLSPTEPS